MQPKLPITDSPWFWVVLFSGMALVALAAMGPKYGGRQSRLELQYQARERIAAQRAGKNSQEQREPDSGNARALLDEPAVAPERERRSAADLSSNAPQNGVANNLDESARMEEQGGRREFASREETLIPLWPLAVLLGGVLLFATVMLVREHGRGPTIAARRCPRPGSLQE